MDSVRFLQPMIGVGVQLVYSGPLTGTSPPSSRSATSARPLAPDWGAKMVRVSPKPDAGRRHDETTWMPATVYEDELEGLTNVIIGKWRCWRYPR